MGKKAIDFCTGCGLCHSVFGVSFGIDDRQFVIPQFEDNSHTYKKTFEICPFGKNGVSKFTGSVWGVYENAYRGYSANADVRFRASSGGVVSSLCMYLLNEHIVDGIILTRADKRIPFQCETFCARTVDEVLSACGSRYSQSSPLMNINNLLKSGEKYCFVGKPCDVSTLKRYMTSDSNLQKQIYCTISFFCAGMPSDSANKRLISELGCNSCVSLRYRGFGWPGKATAIDQNGTEYSMDYQSSWMNILGRDIRKSCKLCFDGIGEYADISCGDIWNLTEDKKPDFSEGEGYNIVFARSKLGDRLINDAFKGNAIFLEDWNSKINELKYSQPNHFIKRTTILSKYIALKLMLQNTPKYKIKRMLSYSRKNDLKTQFIVFKGTLIRILKKRL